MVDEMPHFRTSVDANDDTAWLAVSRNRLQLASA
jgi:hypothetical protein